MSFVHGVDILEPKPHRFPKCLLSRDRRIGVRSACSSAARTGLFLATSGMHNARPQPTPNSTLGFLGEMVRRSPRGGSRLGWMNLRQTGLSKHDIRGMELIAVVLDGLSAGDGFFPMRGRFIEDFFGFRCPPLLEQRLSEPGQHQAKDISPRCMLRLVMHESFLDCAASTKCFSRYSSRKEFAWMLPRSRCLATIASAIVAFSGSLARHFSRISSSCAKRALCAISIAPRELEVCQSPVRAADRDLE